MPTVRRPRKRWIRALHTLHFIHLRFHRNDLRFRFVVAVAAITCIDYTNYISRIYPCGFLCATVRTVHVIVLLLRSTIITNTRLKLGIVDFLEVIHVAFTRLLHDDLMDFSVRSCAMCMCVLETIYAVTTNEREEIVAVDPRTATTSLRETKNDREKSNTIIPVEAVNRP